MADEKKQNLAATCGLYCGACPIYLAGKRGDSRLLEQAAKGLLEVFRQEAKGMPPVKKGAALSQLREQMLDARNLVCDGCRSDTVAAYCRVCAFPGCAIEKGVTHCYACQGFPCQEIIDFNNDGMRHHAEVLDNVQRQREIGLNAWLEEQGQRWACPECGAARDWYAKSCFDCGADLPTQETGRG